MVINEKNYCKNCVLVENTKKYISQENKNSSKTKEVNKIGLLLAIIPVIYFSFIEIRIVFSIIETSSMYSLDLMYIVGSGIRLLVFFILILSGVISTLRYISLQIDSKLPIILAIIASTLYIAISISSILNILYIINIDIILVYIKSIIKVIVGAGLIIASNFTKNKEN